MSTYNTYFNQNIQLGKSIPVWLGVVSPIPVGAALASDFAKAGVFIPAGTPMALADGVASPFHGFVVTNYTTSSSNSIITVKPIFAGDAPKTSDFLQKVGATFAATGKAWNPDAIAANQSDAEAFDITVATANIDVVAEGDVLGYSSAVAEGSSKSLAVQPAYYLYNDVAIPEAKEDASVENVQASVALVNFHGEGILINRTPAAALKAQMKAAVPNVIQEDRF